MIPHLSIHGPRTLVYSNATVAVKMDGNSLVYGYRNPGPGNTVAEQIVSQVDSPLYGSGITVTNLGVNSQTWQTMLNTLPTFTAGKLNIVIAWEGSNSIKDGESGVDAVGLAEDYISAVKAVNPAFRIVIMNCLPRQGSAAVWGSVNALNAQIDAYNALLKSSYREIGADLLCDLRPPGGVFDMGGDYSDGNFAACDTRAGATVWLEATGRIHLTDAGDTVIAGLLAATLRHVR